MKLGRAIENMVNFHRPFERSRLVQGEQSAIFAKCPPSQLGQGHFENIGLVIVCGNQFSKWRFVL